MALFPFEQTPVYLLGLAAVLLLGLEAWRRAAARAKRHMARIADLEARIETLRDEKWEIAEREARYRDLVRAQGDLILRNDRAALQDPQNLPACAGAGLPEAPVRKDGRSPRSACGRMCRRRHRSHR